MTSDGHPGYYADDLAHIHDAGYDHYARAAAPVILGALKDANHPAGGLVVDLGCGSGILSPELVAAGYDVLGIELSEALIALARQRVPGATFHVGSLLSADIPSCLGVTAIGEVVNFLFDTSLSPQTLEGLFQRIHTALVPGG